MNWEVRTMRSATSFFNGTIFRKNLTRFWPLWALYALIWTYALPVQCLLARQQSWAGSTVRSRVADFAQNVPNLLPTLGMPLAALFGILTAMAMFSYLYNSRSACQIHSLPVRREGLFLSGYLSGLVCLLLPNLVIFLFTLAAEASGGAMDLAAAAVWLGAQSGMCLFFFSFGVFCAMFTGHLLALPAFYVIFNGLAAALLGLLDSLIPSFLYGYGGVSDRVADVVYWLVPALRLGSSLFWERLDGGGSVFHGGGVVAAYAGAGLVLAALALAVYRRRHVESAGDVVSVPLLRPVFKYGVAVCSALCLGYWLYIFLGLSGLPALVASLLLWCAIGYFVAEMLLRKSFRVLGAWKGCAVLLALVCLGVAALHLDLFGYTTRLPAREDIQSVSVSGLYSSPYDAGHYLKLDLAEEAELIDKALAVHQAVIDQREAGEKDWDITESFRVTYWLKNGSSLTRSYRDVPLTAGAPLAQAAEALLNDPRAIAASYDLDRVDEQRLIEVGVFSLWDEAEQTYTDRFLSELGLGPGEMRQVFQAVLLDVQEGNLGQRYLFDNDPRRESGTCLTDLSFDWEATERRPQGGGETEIYTTSESLTVTLTPQAEHTLAALRELGVCTDAVYPVPYGFDPSQP